MPSKIEQKVPIQTKKINQILTQQNLSEAGQLPKQAIHECNPNYHLALPDEEPYFQEN